MWQYKLPLPVVLALLCLLPVFIHFSFYREHAQVDIISANKLTEIWPGNLNCHPSGYTVSPVKLKVTMLISFPGSGNTWLRYLVTSATGLMTGSIHEARILDHIQLSNCRTRACAEQVPLVKSHGEVPEELKADRIILLIRNPYEALLAEFNRQGEEGTGLHHNYASASAFGSKWSQYVKKYMVWWRSTYANWNGTKFPVHVIVYHRLVAHVERELRRLFQFVNEPSVRPNYTCVRAFVEGPFHREKRPEQEKMAVFDARQIQYLNSAILDVEKVLETVTGENFSDFKSWMRSP